MDKILFVDDEENILQSFRREFRRQFEVVTATSAEEGLRAIAAQGPFAVVVSDFRLPEGDGNHFLAAAKEAAPETVRVMLTGHSDVNMAMRAINEGSVFRFLTKPCPSDTLGKALTLSVHQYKLVMAERQLRASEQQLRAANQQLEAKEHALRISRDELTTKVAELKRFNRLLVGRELEMIKLKQQINALLEELGRPKRYEAPERIMALHSRFKMVQSE